MVTAADTPGPSPQAPASLPSPAREAGHFWQLRGRILRTVLLQAVRHARLRTALILGLTVVFWAGMLLVFLEGFQLMRSMITHEGTRAETVHAIFNVFFLSLMGMLTLSSAILLYSGLYRSRETCFLLTMPVRIERIVLFKFQETLLLSCWGFFLLGSPLLVAYGRISGAPWYYYIAFLPFMIAFAFIPVSVGAILCLLVVRYLTRLRVHAVIAFVLTALLLLGAGGWTLVREAHASNTMTMEWFQNTLRRLQYSEQRWFPSWWLSSGLLEAAHPARDQQQVSWRESLGFLSVLASNAMLLYVILGHVARRHYVAGFSSLAEMGSTRKRATAGIVDRLLMWTICPLPKVMRLLLLKDLRVFRRDILQWSQFAIFFGLLIFYFLNIRRLQYGQTVSGWMMVVGYLNVGVVGLLLATFTTRFIYPLISLEGRRFWILGTLPIDRRDILWSKFLFACGISLVPCAVLVLVSDVMLQLAQRSLLVVILHQLTCAALCLGLSGMAVGLGARLPNLRDTAPAKIASGFGGTVTLVLSVAFILVTVTCTAVPTCCWLQNQPASSSTSDLISLRLGSLGAVVLGVIATIGLGLAATTIPLWSGLQAFRRLEP